MKSMLNLKALCLTLVLSTTPAMMSAGWFKDLICGKPAPVVEATRWSRFTSAVSGYATSAKDAAISAKDSVIDVVKNPRVNAEAAWKRAKELSTLRNAGIATGVLVATGFVVAGTKWLYDNYYNTPERQAKNAAKAHKQMVTEANVAYNARIANQGMMAHEGQAKVMHQVQRDPKTLTEADYARVANEAMMAREVQHAVMQNNPMNKPKGYVEPTAPVATTTEVVKAAMPEPTAPVALEVTTANKFVGGPAVNAPLHSLPQNMLKKHGRSRSKGRCARRCR